MTLANNISVRVKGLDKLKRALDERFKNSFSPTLRLRLGRLAREIIYKRVKSGKGVTDLTSEPQKNRLKPLSTSYIEVRKGLAKYFVKDGSLRRVPNSESFRIDRPKLGPFGSPNRSNLTFTGQMLESLSYEATARGFRVFVPSSSRRNESVTNAQVARWVQEQGRNFLALTPDELTILVREIEREVRKLTRRKL